MVFWVILISAWLTWFCNFFWSLVNERDLIHTVWCETFLIKLCVFGHDYIYIYNIYIYIIYIYTYGTVHHVPKSMSCHKVIVVITGRAYCFHDNTYIMLFLLLWDLSTLCAPWISYGHYIYIYIYIYICYILYIYLSTGS